MTLVSDLLSRCTFPPSGSSVHCAFSGGPDSSALLILARAAGLSVTAHHVDHGLRPSSADEAATAVGIAQLLDIDCVVHRAEVDASHNLEAHARAARQAVLPPDALTGHTLDDQ
ncbi:MAG: tRNA(Ile)-lysidine synthetase, partial [Actinobacteria bacterium]|nr:tRNA(Ile)-lysidine synthetase [Actinomycetota bacterium]